MLNILLRTLIIYILLVIAMRIGGKRQIGQLQLSELVSALLLSEIASMPIGHEEIPLTFAVIPIVTVICVEIIAAFAVTKSKKLSTLFDGTPSVIISKGKLNIAEMKKLRLSIEELIVEARMKGISDISDLQYAILESGGELSVFKKESVKTTENTSSIAPANKETSKKSPLPPDKGIAHILISDGQISDQGLTTVGLTRKALNGKLHAKKLLPEEVFLYTVDDAGNEFIVKMEDKK